MQFYWMCWTINTCKYYKRCLVVKLAPLAGKSMFAYYHDADYLSTVKPNHRHSFHIYICLLSTSIHKERSLSVSHRLPQFTVEKNVLEFLNDLKFILYLKYDNCSTSWCMTRLPLLPIIYIRAHYIIQLEMWPRASSVWRGVRRLCGMYKFTTNSSCG
jgi:hypothetical protein